MDYIALKTIHVSCVAASYALFFVRGVWMIRKSPLLRQIWVRTLPHVVDTVLLASALAMAAVLRQFPFVSGWLTAKLMALMLYIFLGMVALKYGRQQRTRVVAWIAAQAVFLYIVAVAVSRNPLPFTG